MRRPLLLLALLAALACRQGDPAELILRGGRVYPFAHDSAAAEAVAIRDGRILFVGSDAEAMDLAGRATRVLDLAGRMVLPAFRDTHVHPRGGIQLGECTLDELTIRQAILDSVVRYAAGHPDRAWIRGSGWQLPVFPDANPRKEWLDSIVPDRPVYLRAADGHSAWVNSRALALAGITRETPDPPNGRIERDPQTGEPSGTLRESAMGLVTPHLPARAPAEIRAGLQRALALANRYGIVALVEAAASPDLLAGYAELDRAGLLTARVKAAVQVDPGSRPHLLDSLRAWRARYQGRAVAVRAAKLFLDGVIEAKTAALLAPYAGGGDDRGEPNFAPAALDSLVGALDAAGFEIHAHAIGDRAVRMALDAVAAARRLNGPRDARPIVAHLELIDPADIPRFAAEGVIPSFQPLWAQADEYITRLTEPVLGPARSRWLYPIGSVARSGAMLAAGNPANFNVLDGDRVVESSVFVSFHDYELALLEQCSDAIEERVVPESVLVRAKERVGERVARLVASRADAIVAAAEAIAEEARALAPSGRVVTIPNGCDFDDFAGLEYHPGEHFRITHAGSFFGKRDPRPFLTALHESGLDDVVARFVGDFRDSDRGWAEGLGLGDRLELVPYVSRRRALELQRDSEALLLLIPESGGRGRAVLSAKVFEYLAAERPILAAVPPDGAAAELIRETGAGVVVAPDDVDGLREALVSLEGDWRAGKLNGTPLAPEVRARLARRARAEELAELARSLV